MGRAAEADALAADLVRLGEERADVNLAGMARLVRGLAAVYAGSPEEAERHLAAGLPLVAAHGTRWHHALGTVWRGAAALARGELERAEELADEALALSRELPALVLVVFARELAGWVQLARGDLAGVWEIAEEVVDLSRRSDTPGGLARVLDLAGFVEHAVGADERAAILLAAGTAERERLGLARAPHEATPVARAQVSLRRGLGEARHDELVAEGGLLGLDGAVALLWQVAVPQQPSRHVRRPW